MADLTIVGINHLHPASAATVSSTFAELEPDVVLVELDEKRMSNLDPLRDDELFPLPITQMKPREWVIYRQMVFTRRIRSFRRLVDPTNSVGSSPEYTAIVESHKTGTESIPMDKNFTKTVDLSELLVESSVETARLMNKTPPEATEEDLVKLHNELAPVMPTIIRERNEHMAKVITEQVSEYGTVMAVTGMAHVKGIEYRLDDNITVEVYT